MRARIADVIGPWLSDQRLRQKLAFWMVLTVAFGGAGPFGTFHALGLGGRLLFWAAILGAGMAAIAAMRALVFGPLRMRHPLPGAILVAMLFAFVMAPLVQQLIKALPGAAAVAAPDLFLVAGTVFCLSLATAMCRHGTQGPAAPPGPEAGTPPARAPEAPVLPRLVNRLPPQVRGPLISVSVRDHYVDVTTHYVDVTTRAGTASLLLRLSDAIAETGEDEGVQVHRSHWVAWTAIDAVELRGARMVLRLSNGAEVPVSKSHRPRVQARGIGITRAV